MEQLPGTRAGTPIGGAVTPDCADTGGSPGSPTDIHASRIRGLSPDVAIVSGGSVLVAAGYLPQLPSFPLQRPGSSPADLTRNCTTGPPVPVDGTADGGFSGLAVRRAPGGLVRLDLDSGTRIVGLSRHGLPFIGAGQHVHVTAVHCGTKLVARRITAAGPVVGEAPASRVLGDDWDGVSTPLIHSSAFWISALLLAVAIGGWALHRRLG